MKQMIRQRYVCKLNYKYPACSIILDSKDEHWNDCFAPGELDEIKSALESRTEVFPGAMQRFMDDIPKGEILGNIFKILNNKTINPFESRDVY
ncbi:hypothetical protein RMATCC62417_12463 [Rhizopus microsporus]|nr:hypothetical protein RMATCC62417_12463 [Rhizopus microsporus]